MKINWKLVVLGGVALGLSLLFIEIFFKVPVNEYLENYWYVGIFIVLAVAIIEVVISLLFSKKLLNITKTIYNDDNGEGFILENQRLLEKTRGKVQKNLIRINISAGYSYMRDFESAKAVLEQCDLDNLSGINLTIHSINLAFSNFKLNEPDRAIKIMDACRDKLQKFEQHKTLGGSIATLYILEHIAEGRNEEAKALLEKSLEVCTDKINLRELKDIQGSFEKY